MYAGLAGGLLVFAGLWRATEWMMDGRRHDTWALVPIGAVYLMLGCLLAVGVGGSITEIAALVCVAGLGGMSFMRRGHTDLRQWVIWVFAVFDAAIALALVLALLR